MSNPLGLIKTIVQREIRDTVGAPYASNKNVAFGSTSNYQDIGAVVKSSFVSGDQTDRWFLVGISKWGASGNLVSE